MSSSRTVRLTISALILCTLAMNSVDSANGAPITFTYSGSVSSSDLPQNFIPLGTPLSISYTFNSDAPATVVVPGSVAYGSSIVSSVVTIGTMTFSQPNPGVADPKSEISVFSQPSGNPLQRYDVQGSSMGSLFVTPNLTVYARRWGINLSYQNTPELSHFDLPLSQPSVPDGTGFGTIVLCLEPTGSCVNFNVTAAFTPTPSVPLPSAAYLFLSGLTFMMVLLAKGTILNRPTRMS